MHTNPAYLPLPPPFELELNDAQRRVGWVRGSCVAFRGFADEAEAAHAAWVVHRAMVQRIVASFGGTSAPAEVERLLIARHGDGEAIFADGRYIAALHRPGASEWVGEEHCAIELRVPPPHDEVTMRGLAYALYRALRHSGAQWAIFDSGPPAPLPPRGFGERDSLVGPGMRLAVVAVFAVLVAMLQPLVAPDAPIRMPLLAVGVAALGAAGISEALRRVR